MKKLMSVLFAAACLFGATHLQAQTAPKSVIHVVTVAWKKEATPAQIEAALAGVQELPKSYKGITRVWTKTHKMQNAKGVDPLRTHAFVMEFVDEAALKDYSGSDAQKKWYEVYIPIRESSTTFDITN